jgi:hypothetical protein
VRAICQEFEVSKRKFKPNVFKLALSWLQKSVFIRILEIDLFCKHELKIIEYRNVMKNSEIF